MICQPEIVDWVRTCFYSRFRLPGHEDLVDGVWFDAEPGAPFAEGGTYVGSRDWTSDHRDPWPEFGEYEGARTYYPGFNPCD